MKTLLKHIVIISAVISMAACSMEQLDYPVSNKDSFVEVVARPTSFSSYNVATKAAPLPTAPTEMETRIASAYIMTFGADGTLVEYKIAEVSNNQITPVRLYTNAHKGKLTVYYLVNVPESYVKSIKNISDFSSKDKALPITYATYDRAGAFGVPVVDDQLCFPMAGKVEFNGPAEDGKVKVVPLQRLFAKVYVNLSMTLEDFDIGDGLNFNPPFFRVDNYSLTNLPSKVLIDAPVETPWVSETTDGFFQEAELYKLPTPIHVYDTQVADLTLGGLLGPQRVKEYETVFYVPEYILTSADGASDNNDQSMKADFCPDGKRPLIMTLSGVIHHSGYDITMSYDVYMGSDAFSSFSLYRNTQYNNYLSIKGIDDVFLDDRVEIPGINLADPNETGTEESANCYIISQPGRYLIPTYKGNTAKNSNATTMSGVAGSETIYINGSTANDVQEITMIEKDGKNYIQFDVNLLDDEGTLNPTEVEAGNQLLVLKDESDNIIWSWHLWFCDDVTRPDLDVSMERYPDDSGNWNNKYVMNRALGAIDPITLGNLGFGSDILQYLAGFLGIELNDFLWQDGLYYQWGRKDPLLPVEETIETGASTYNASIQNPQKFYTKWDGSGAGWTAAKSINDPCPPGYKVPEKSIWRSSNPDAEGFEYDVPVVGTINVETTTDVAYTYNLSQNTSATSASGYIFYPYSGNYDEEGKFMTSINDSGTNYTSEDYIIPTDIPQIGKKYSGLEALGRPTSCRRFKKILYDYNASVNHGIIWATNQASLKYGYSNISLQSNSDNIFGNFLEDLFRTFTCDYQEATITYSQSGGILNRTYTVTGISEWSEWKTNQTVTTLQLGHAELREGIQKYLSSLESLNAFMYDPDNDITVSNGAQVRCVRE